MKKKILKITGITLLLIIALLIAIPYFFKDQINAKILESINNSVDAKVTFVDADLIKRCIENGQSIGTGGFEVPGCPLLVAIHFEVQHHIVLHFDLKLQAKRQCAKGGQPLIGRNKGRKPFEIVGWIRHPRIAVNRVVIKTTCIL